MKKTVPLAQVCLVSCGQGAFGAVLHIPHLVGFTGRQATRVSLLLHNSPTPHKKRENTLLEGASAGTSNLNCIHIYANSGAVKSPQPTQPSCHAPCPLCKPRPRLRAPAGCRWAPRRSAPQAARPRPRPPLGAPARRELRPGREAAGAVVGLPHWPRQGAAGRKRGCSGSRALTARGRGARAGPAANRYHPPAVTVPGL